MHFSNGTVGVWDCKTFGYTWRDFRGVKLTEVRDRFGGEPCIKPILYLIDC